MNLPVLETVLWGSAVGKGKKNEKGLGRGQALWARVGRFDFILSRMLLLGRFSRRVARLIYICKS